MDPIVATCYTRNKMLSIVLSFNGIDDTVHCVDSIYSQPGRFDVLVIDRGSQSGVVSRLRQTFPTADIAACDGKFWLGRRK
jgi:GT2 family glycosyltransferase